MIVKKERELTPYELYFTEAPRRKRRPRRVITASPNDGRFRNLDDDIDYGAEDIDLDADMDGLDMDGANLDGMEDDMANMPLEDEPAGEQPPADTDAPAETPPPDDGGLDVGDDMGDDDLVADDEPTPQDGELNTGDPNADGGTDVTPPEDAGAEAPTEGDGLDTGGEAPADDAAGDGLETEDPDADGGDGELDTGDDTGDTGDDGLDVEDPGDGGDTGMDAPPTDTGGDGTNGTANTLDNQLKYSLFRNIKNLYLAIQSYQERLDSINVGSHNYSLAIKSASSKLSDLEDYIFEYMVIKFKDSEYEASMDFYQKCVATVMEIFHLLDNNKENINLKDKTIN